MALIGHVDMWSWNFGTVMQASITVDVDHITACAYYFPLAKDGGWLCE